MAQTPETTSKSTDLVEEKKISVQRQWIKDHMIVIYVAIALILFGIIFFGIRIYNNATHPVTRFMQASAKDFNSSFSFELEAQKNGKSVMAYKGSYQADPAAQNVKAVYEADYGSYTYTGAVYAEGETRINGNCYKGKWRTRDCSEKVLNFFDFNTDYKNGHFDAASFLRFTDLTSQYSPDELNSFMKLIKNRMSGNTSLAKITSESKDGAKTYTCDLDLNELFRMVRDEGASIFHSAIDYENFCAMYELNQQTVRQSECTLTFTVNGDGYMSEFRFELDAGDSDFAVFCKMADFGSAEVEIPDEFFEAEVAEDE